ncbi:MAG: AsmA-like C-terminal region-containing protein [Bacteroidota bacterium]|nr:AsmA-like C-terminal region-containing protein [Bacteroidota bacterium]
MKKITRIILKVLIGLILLVLILLFTVPILFKGKIKAKIEQTINESVNARVNIADYRVGFFRNFPNLSLSLKNVSVAGIDMFEKDTLINIKNLDLVFNLASLFSKTGYEVKSIIIDKAVVKALVLKDGSANWDIMKDTTETSATEVPSSSMKILLKRIEIHNSSVSYIDQESDIEARLNKLSSSMNGDLTENETNLAIDLQAGEVTYIMDGVKYLDKAVADSRINLLAKLDSMKFYIKDNYLDINDLRLNFAGMVEMPYDDIGMDLTYKTERTSFKSLLSLVPAIYAKDFKDLRANGEFSLSGTAKGVYSDADSTMPDMSMNIKVDNGLISYPSLPEKISNINLKSEVFVDGKDLDKTKVDVDKFHMELAGNPFDMSFSLKTPMSDPDFRGSMNGKLDLGSLSKAIPMDSISLSGLIDMSVNMAGKMSMIEKQKYESVRAEGKMNISGMLVAMKGYPAVEIQNAGLEFTPAYASLTDAELKIGRNSDFYLNGRLANYIPYVLKNETIRGNLDMHSKLVDMTEIMSSLGTDTTQTEDTTSLAIIKIPKNIDFDFNALIDKFNYNKIKVNNVKGHIIVKDGIMSLRETGMDLLGGKIAMNADYDTRDTLKPSVKADLSIESLGIKDAFNTFNTIQMLAPTAKGLSGKVGTRLTYSSLLKPNFMPVISTITGSGKLQSNEVTLLESAAYKKMKEILKLGDNYSNTFKDINVSFKINEGRIYVSPFNTKVGNLKMNISGDQGIDQTINYIVKTEIPRSDLGNSVNSLIDNLSAQAAAFGFGFKPADIIKVNVKVTGTFLKPVITPLFGNAPSDSTKGIKETAKESIKQVAGEKADQAKEKARNEAEAQADRLIKDAEEKGQQIRDEAAKGAEKIRQEADLQAQRLIKEAESKGPIAKAAAQKAADAIKKEADKKATQLTQGADTQANKLLEDAKAKKEELLK